MLPALSFLWRERGRLGLLVVSVLLLALSARCYTLRTSLVAERAAHNATMHALGDAVTEGNRWAAVARQANTTAAAQAEYAAACLEREARTVSAAAERAAILATAKPRPRTDAVRQEVIDDASRLGAAARLNRPW